jgi:hypothetical protein
MSSQTDVELLKVEIEGSQPILHLPYIGFINKDKTRVSLLK